MTTRTKISITIYVWSTMMLLNVFSKPLHIPEAFDWVLLIGMFIPLGLTFYYIKRQKLEKQQPSGSADAAAAQSVDATRQSVKKRLILMMVLGVLVGLCAPLWLPVTGSSLGVRGDFICGIITAVVVCVIVGFRLRKI
jgi:hypothetical protein